MPCLICIIFVADLIACRLHFFMSAVEFTIVWMLLLVPVAPSRKVWRVLRFLSKLGNSSLCFSRAGEGDQEHLSSTASH